MTRHVILGNGIAGQTCAEVLRSRDSEAEITVVAAEPHPLYSRVALPRYLRGQIDEPSVMLRTFEGVAERGIRLMAGCRALRIDPGERIVATDSGEDLRYDSLLIATGGRPKPPPWPGARAGGNVHAFQMLDDARRLIALAEGARSVLVIGGGFIGYELAEAIAYRGTAQVTWVLRASRFLSGTLDAEAGRICADLAAAASVSMACNAAVVWMEDGPAGGATVHFTDGRVASFDLVAYGVGLEYAVEVAASAGLEVRGGIVTDSSLRTSAPGVCAAGDVAVFWDEARDAPNQMGSWDSAQAQGAAVAAAMAGDPSPFVDVPTYTTTLFGSAIAVLGDVRGTPELRVCRASGRYQALYFRSESLIGAILIGPPKGRKKIIDLIRSGAACGAAAFDLLPS